jgi:hypothetical protein
LNPLALLTVTGKFVYTGNDTIVQIVCGGNTQNYSTVCINTQRERGRRGGERARGRGGEGVRKEGEGEGGGEGGRKEEGE